MIMSEWIKIAAVGDLEPGKKKMVQAGALCLTLVNVEGAYYAIEDTCPHMGAPLAQGLLKGNLLTCGWHGWRFDVCTGKAVRGDDGLKTWQVKVEGEEIFVRTED